MRATPSRLAPIAVLTCTLASACDEPAASTPAASASATATTSATTAPPPERFVRVVRCGALPREPLSQSGGLREVSVTERYGALSQTRSTYRFRPGKAPWVCLGFAGHVRGPLPPGQPYLSLAGVTVAWQDEQIRDPAERGKGTGTGLFFVFDESWSEQIASWNERIFAAEGDAAKAALCAEMRAATAERAEPAREPLDAATQAYLAGEHQLERHGLDRKLESLATACGDG